MPPSVDTTDGVSSTTAAAQHSEIKNVSPPYFPDVLDLSLLCITAHVSLHVKCSLTVVHVILLKLCSSLFHTQEMFTLDTLLQRSFCMKTYFICNGSRGFPFII